MSLKQFFILGNPRSGTSMLRLLLNSHSAITVAPECGFLLWLFSAYKQWDEKKLTLPHIKNFVQDVCNSKKFETWGVTAEALEKTIIERAPKTYASLAQCVYLTYANKFKKKPQVLGDKNNYYIKHLKELDAVFSAQHILHIVRDGRDVAASYKKLQELSFDLKYKPELATEIQTIADEWQTNNLNIYNHYKSDSNYFMIKYEDILVNPKQALQPFLRALDLDFEQGMLAFYEHNKTNVIEPRETMAWKQKTLQPLDPNNIGTYELVLQPEEVIVFNETANKALKHFGYEG